METMLQNMTEIAYSHVGYIALLQQLAFLYKGWVGDRFRDRETWTCIALLAVLYVPIFECSCFFIVDWYGCWYEKTIYGCWKKNTVVDMVVDMVDWYGWTTVDCCFNKTTINIKWLIDIESVSHVSHCLAVLYIPILECSCFFWLESCITLSGQRIAEVGRNF